MKNLINKIKQNWKRIKVALNPDKYETILCAAIWYNDFKEHPNQHNYEIPNGFVICGYRHFNIIGVLPSNPRYEMPSDPKDNEVQIALRNLHIPVCDTVQGFLTSKGRFVDRGEALIIATDAGQVKFSKNLQLFSEDLY